MFKAEEMAGAEASTCPDVLKHETSVTGKERERENVRDDGDLG